MDEAANNAAHLCRDLAVAKSVSPCSVAAHETDPDLLDTLVVWMPYGAKVEILRSKWLQAPPYCGDKSRLR